MESSDLSDTNRLNELFLHAKRLNLCGGTQCDKLDFFALACYCFRVGKSPARLFRSLLYNHKLGTGDKLDYETAKLLLHMK